MSDQAQTGGGSGDADTQSPRNTVFHELKSPPADIIEDARNGRMFVLVDHEDRENEGDLVIPAQMCTPEKERRGRKSRISPLEPG